MYYSNKFIIKIDSIINLGCLKIIVVFLDIWSNLELFDYSDVFIRFGTKAISPMFSKEPNSRSGQTVKVKLYHKSTKFTENNIKMYDSK